MKFLLNELQCEYKESIYDIFSKAIEKCFIQTTPSYEPIEIDKYFKSIFEFASGKSNIAIMECLIQDNQDDVPSYEPIAFRKCYVPTDSTEFLEHFNSWFSEPLKATGIFVKNQCTSIDADLQYRAFFPKEKYYVIPVRFPSAQNSQEKVCVNICYEYITKSERRLAWISAMHNSHEKDYLHMHNRDPVLFRMGTQRSISMWSSTIWNYQEKICLNPCIRNYVSFTAEAKQGRIVWFFEYFIKAYLKMSSKNAKLKLNTIFAASNLKKFPYPETRRIVASRKAVRKEPLAA